MSTTTLTTADFGSTSSTTSAANIYTNSPDDVFLASGESLEKPCKGKGLKVGYVEHDKEGEGVENHYERLEADVEHGYVVHEDCEAPDLPERFACDIKDIHGDKICMATKLADC